MKTGINADQKVACSRDLDCHDFCDRLERKYADLYGTEYKMCSKPIDSPRINCSRYCDGRIFPWCEEMQDIARAFHDITGITVDGASLNAEYTNQYRAYLRKAVDMSIKYNAPCRKCTVNYLIGNFEGNLSDLSCDSERIEEEKRYRENDNSPKDEFIENLFIELSGQ